MTFTVVIPVYGRTLLARRVVGHLQRQGVAGILTVGDESTGLTDHLWASNEPVGAKFNRGIACAPRDTDYVCVVGSDSFIHPDYLDAVRALDVRHPYVNTNGAYFYWPWRNLMLFNPKFRCGSGVFLSRALLERCDYKPYYEDRSRDLDSGPRRYAGCGGFHEFRTPWVLEERGEENMWSEDWLRSSVWSEEVEDPQAIIDDFRI